MFIFATFATVEKCIYKFPGSRHSLVRVLAGNELQVSERISGSAR
jgi:hypothetical protein